MKNVPLLAVALFVAGLFVVVTAPEQADAGWFPGKFAGRVVANGIHRRQDRRAARRSAHSCGGVETVAQSSSLCHASASGCHSLSVESVPAPVPAPVVESVPAPAATIAPAEALIAEWKESAVIRSGPAAAAADEALRRTIAETRALLNQIETDLNRRQAIVRR